MRPVWPTTRGWVLLLGSLIWMLVAAVNGKMLPAVMALGGIGVCSASFLFALISLRNIHLERGPIGDAVTGRTVAMPLRICNLSRMRCQDFVVLENCGFATETTTLTGVAPLLAGETRLVERRVLAMRRGIFELDRIVVRSGDPAGLFKRDKLFSQPRRIVVVPGVESLTNLNLHPAHVLGGVAGAPISAAGTSQEVYAVREYHPGDGLRRIHWKSSARFRKLMVREFERNTVTSVAVLLDAYEPFVTGPEPWSNLEYQVRAAASVCHHVAGLYCQLSFAAGGDEGVVIPPALSSELEEEIMFRLALLKPGRIKVEDVAVTLGEQLPRESVLFCFSLSATRSLATTLELLAAGGVSVRWYCAAPEAFSDAVRRQSEGQKPLRWMQSGEAVSLVHLHPGISINSALCNA